MILNLVGVPSFFFFLEISSLFSGGRFFVRPPKALFFYCRFFCCYPIFSVGSAIFLPALPRVLFLSIFFAPYLRECRRRLTKKKCPFYYVLCPPLSPLHPSSTHNIKLKTFKSQKPSLPSMLLSQKFVNSFQSLNG